MQGDFQIALASFLAYIMASQDDLRSLWLEGHEGSLCSEDGKLEKRPYSELESSLGREKSKRSSSDATLP